MSLHILSSEDGIHFVLLTKKITPSAVTVVVVGSWGKTCTVFVNWVIGCRWFLQIFHVIISLVLLVVILQILIIL